MGKSKSKKNQLKRYDTPTDKYLVVDNPPGGNPSERNFFDHVTSWFEIMFKEKYPGTRPSAIFYTSTQRCLIVEIPDFIDTEPYLGAHYWSMFLSKPWYGKDVTCIYDFSFRFFPLPPQMGWKAGYAVYRTIPSEGFWVKDPYPNPPSLPAPNSLMPFACKLTGDKLLAAGQDIALPLFMNIPNNNLVEEKPNANSSAQPLTSQPRTSSEDIKPLYSSAIPSKPPLLLPLKPPASSLASTSRMPLLTPLASLKPLQRNPAVSTSISASSLSSSSRNPSQDPRGKLEPMEGIPQRRTTNPDTSLYQQYRAPGHLAEAEKHAEPSPTPETKRSSSSMAPPHLPSSKLTNKLDPYEEEEVAKELLRRSHSSSLPPPNSTTTRFSSITSEIEVKRELLEVDNLLNDIINPSRTVSVRPSQEQDSQSYAPSNELLEAFQSIQNDQYLSQSSIPDVSVPKNEVVEGGLPDYLDEDEEEYQPSTELMAAFAALQQQEVGPDTNPLLGSDTAVKAEPKEDIIPILPSHTQSRPVGVKREASFTLPSESDHDIKRVRVKREPEW